MAKVTVAGQRFADAQVAHDDETEAIGEGPIQTRSLAPRGYELQVLEHIPTNSLRMNEGMSDRARSSARPRFVKVSYFFSFTTSASRALSQAMP